MSKKKALHLVWVLVVPAIALIFVLMNEDMLMVYKREGIKTDIFLAVLSVVFVILYTSHERVSILTKISNALISISTPKSKVVLLFYAGLSFFLIFL